jgi:hypothetical protein
MEGFANKNFLAASLKKGRAGMDDSGLESFDWMDPNVVDTTLHVKRNLES